jgi:hypothetical protein
MKRFIPFLLAAALITPSAAVATNYKPDNPPTFKPDKPERKAHKKRDRRLFGDEQTFRHKVVVETPEVIPNPVPPPSEGDVIVIITSEAEGEDEPETEAPAIPAVSGETVEETVGEALSVVVAPVEQSGADRAGYCAPVPMLRTGDGSYGIYMDLFKDDASRALYHSWGFTDAKIDPITGASSC